MLNKVKILIIDSGVWVEHPDLKNEDIKGMLWIDGEMRSEIYDNFGHGTAVYGIIRNACS